MRAPLADACLVLFALGAFCGSARAQEPSALDYIRRTFDRPVVAEQRTATRPGPTDGAPATAGAHLPLLLPPSVWTGTVLKTQVAEHGILDAILQARGPALLYYGLFSLDDETRAWLAGRPELVSELAGRAAGPFVVAAPGIRVRGSALLPPGGAEARGAWESVAGQSMDDPERFIRALVTRDDGRVAFFFGAMAGLSPGQLHAAFRLDRPDGDRVEAGKRLMAAFERVLLRRRIDDHVFWRPVLDPALLTTHLTTGRDGRPILPGDRAFWYDVLDESPRVFLDLSPGRLRGRSSEPADIAWLASQVFKGDRGTDRRRYDLVLFVSRMAARDPHWTTSAAVGPIRATRAYPALMLSLERAGVTDPAVYEAAARRADAIARLPVDERGLRTLAQFQGAVALVLRASRTSEPRALGRTIAAISAIELSDQGEYDGRLGQWLEGWLAPADGDLEHAAITALAGPSAPDPRFVEWEGTRYRVDLSSAESKRLLHHLGGQPRTWLSTARTLATASSMGNISGEEATRLAGVLDNIAAQAGWDDEEIPDYERAPANFREARSLLAQLAKRADARTAARLQMVLRRLADDLLGRGLMELAYAAAFGHPDRTTISAGEAAARHVFSTSFQGAPAVAWQLPEQGTTPNRSWHLSGSLLGLDIALAEHRLVRLSKRFPSQRPTLNGDHRRVLVSAVALMEPSSLDDKDRAAMLAAIRAGRERLAAARTADDAAALAEDMNLSPLRRTLLAWAVTSARDSLDRFLSMSELLWLGLRGQPMQPSWNRWGVPAGARTGCLCLDMPDRQPWETLTGRVNSGALASAFPDLNLRLAELLDELHMPAPLLGPVLGPATLELVENAAMRDPDDRAALLDFVRRLRRERVEEYLALLTDDGPLVAVDRGDDR